ncbi:hypothetical protein HDU93_007458 [Gonapodya sp. JEL0774]|nr:hypothetical protein HDU93_007458 [Gonapodya sp. JEL0774]
MTLATDTNALTVVGKTPTGSRFIATVTGGKLDGLVNGTVIGPAGDWVMRRADSTNVIDVRLTIITADTNEYIYMTYGGYMLSPSRLAELQSQGVLIDDSIVRMTCRFETASTKYAWLNSVIGIGRGKPTPGGVIYDVFQAQ